MQAFVGFTMAILSFFGVGPIIKKPNYGNIQVAPSCTMLENFNRRSSLYKE
jgi:hypothetical protein